MPKKNIVKKDSVKKPVTKKPIKKEKKDQKIVSKKKSIQKEKQSVETVSKEKPMLEKDQGRDANLKSPKLNERETTAYGVIEKQQIIGEMKTCYLDYAMSVIVSRALPDVRDGLKPVHRRILYAMWSIGLRASAKYRKSATVVGEVLGKYHPHGDSAVYEAMVRMAQDFSMRYMLVNGQGNFGSMDGDGAAAMRYTEAKMARIAEELLFDIDKNTIDFIPNYDGSHKEPTVLPAKLPSLLLNGVTGIAVGMATSIPPHNLAELIDAIKYLIQNPDCHVIDLLEFVKGPDFPTGGIAYSKKDIEVAYTSGRGGVVVRGKADIHESKSDSYQIIITEIPFQVNKSNLVAKIAELVKDKRLEGVRDLRDESGKEGVRIVIDLKKDSYPKKILNALYKNTQLQETFHYNMLALVDGIQPKVLNLKIILEEYLKHREEVVTRRTQFELDRSKARAYILEGLMIALRNIDAVIKVIKASKDKDVARLNLMKSFKLTEIQAIAILEMRLQNLANLEKLKIENELKEKLALIKDLMIILASKVKIRGIINDELDEIREKYGDERRTKIVTHDAKEFNMEDLVPNEETMLMMTRDGYIKRMPPDTFKVQARGGKGVIGLTTKEEDSVEFMFTTMTHSDILFFSTKGRVFQLKAYELPVASRTAKGTPIVNFMQLPGEEKITSILPLDKMQEKKFLFFTTKKGIVKKVVLNAFNNVRRSGLIAIKIKDEDRLIWVKATEGHDQIQLVTSAGQSIRFEESDVRDMGRGAAGVFGIKIKGDDEVVGMGVIKKANLKKSKYQIMSIMANGYGKRSDVELYKVQGRSGSGIKTAKVTEKTGRLVNAFVVNADTMKEKDLIIISEKGQVIRLPFKSINQLGRDTQGVRIMSLKQAGDSVACVTWV